MARIDSYPRRPFDPGSIETLETTRLELLVPEPTVDMAEDLFTLYSKPENGLYNAWEPVSTKEEMQDRLATWQRDWKDGVKFKWVIRERALKRHIGDITLVKFDMRWHEVEIGFNLVLEHWRKGYMSEALSRVLQFVFTDLRLRRVSAYVDSRNEGSLALLRKFGFSKVGQFKPIHATNELHNIQILHLDQLVWASDQIAFHRYRPEMQPAFERINTPWLREYGYLNEGEKAQLQDPVGTILSRGGEIYFAEWDGKLVGTGCLKPARNGNLELVKFAVEADARGHNIGRLLLRHLIFEARKAGANSLELYSHPNLKQAIKLYQKAGFREVDIPEDDPYQGRCEIRMLLPLKQNHGD